MSRVQGGPRRAFIFKPWMYGNGHRMGHASRWYISCVSTRAGQERTASHVMPAPTLLSTP